MGIRMDKQGGYEDLKAHIGHKIEVIGYQKRGSKKDPVNVAIECETCNCVLVDFEQPTKADLKAAKLPYERESAADTAFGRYDFGKEGVEVVDSDGWETDGPDRLIKKFYYEDPENRQADSKVAQFTVDFKKDKATIVEAYANIE